MRIKFLLIALLASFIGFSQSINDYKAVIVPLKYDFLKTENQYRMSTMTKSNLNKAGFQAFYANEQLPAGYGDRCDLLYVDVKRDNGFLVTKLFVEFKDCYGKVIYTSEIGKSKEKDYEIAYRECLDLAFVSITGLHYKYSGKSVAPTVKAVPVSPAAASVATSSTLVLVAPAPDLKDPNLLYAQPTESGYQLIDKTPKVVMKLLKTSQTNVFIAIKDNVQGSLILKEDGQWYFESYQNDKLVSEKIVVKF
ncbi:hypothetical protein CLU81_1951 [Flavobacterium sp. 9]|uniref:hypothetical protein n=1 Tax=Flavobacterium sp. 9 TaxID=2035198 RepID=UPI000C1A82C9|nr:hypothetical protein [Flavobacterium sp. 9]PIF31462.1 hypothetical protein CLU81_1951 [Flavobacterium sp. 9]